LQWKSILHRVIGFCSRQIRLNIGEKLAKISGIVLAYPDLRLAIEGNTDSVGSDAMNQQLSEQRASSVRDHLTKENIPSASMTSQGFGKTQPVASNDTAEGREQNRRVELVVSGEVIGTTIGGRIPEYDPNSPSVNLSSTRAAGPGGSVVARACGASKKAGISQVSSISHLSKIIKINRRVLMKVGLWMSGSALFLLALTGVAVQAQDRGQDQEHRDQGRHDQDHHDQYRDDQRGQDHSRFDEHDRQASRDWYNEHHDRRPMGLRDRDQLAPEYESRLREGYVLDRNMRRRIYSVPDDYYRRLPPPPRGYRYVFIGGHAVLIDNGYRVHDVIHFELNF
jgi:Ni/Co efflux regulator RcnB